MIAYMYEHTYIHTYICASYVRMDGGMSISICTCISLPEPSQMPLADPAVTLPPSY